MARSEGSGGEPAPNAEWAHSGERGGGERGGGARAAARAADGGWEALDGAGTAYRGGGARAARSGRTTP